MGAASSKPARTAPARYVAKQLPRQTADIAAEFARAKNTIQGINKTKEHVHTTPQPYTERAYGADSTEKLDLTAPKWYVNSFLDMLDQGRECHTVISGNLPFAWERDKFEPYALVRNRIDDEDLDWLLSDNIKNQPVDVLLEHTKLERTALEDILATVERPRVQFRNFQGKIHKAVDDQNSFLTDRKAKMDLAREDELLREIGYTEEEIEDDRQYRSHRPRGVKTLDDLGVSIRERKRADRAKQHDDMQALLQQRKQEAIEKGEFAPTEEDLLRDPDQLSFVGKGTHQIKYNKEKNIYGLDVGRNNYMMSRLNWWATRRRNIPRHADAMHGIEEHNERLTQTEEKRIQELQEAIEFSKAQQAAAGAKTWVDPRAEYDMLVAAIREHKEREEQAKKEMEEIQRSIYSPEPKGGPTPKVVPLTQQFPPESDEPAATIIGGTPQTSSSSSKPQPPSQSTPSPESDKPKP